MKMFYKRSNKRNCMQLMSNLLMLFSLLWSRKSVIVAGFFSEDDIKRIELISLKRKN